MISSVIRRLYIRILAIGLVGYAFLGRGFSYIGVPPIYVDAFLLLVSGLVLLCNPRWIQLLRLPQTWVLLGFMVWGLIRTLPYIPSYGLDALRDAVIWLYGFFALATGYTVFRDDLFRHIVGWYGKWMYRLVLWSPIALGIYWAFGDILPRLPWGPGGGVPILNPKGGDIAVHLAGAVAFVQSVAPFSKNGKSGAVKWFPWLFWPAWLVAFILVGVTVRAALLAVGVSLMVLGLLVDVRRWIAVIAMVSVLLSGIALSDIEIDVGRNRKISWSQLVINVQSILGEASGFSGEETKRWRLTWWDKIIDYTLFGDYFWTGKGFGINLADDDGFQVLPDRSLRSPHNDHLSILARSGVPGFVLWCAFQIGLVTSLLLGYWRNRLFGLVWEAGLCLWCAVYWLAAVINATFDVYLEGPQGGVWFWNIVGLGLGLLLRNRVAGRDAHFAGS